MVETVAFVGEFIGGVAGLGTIIYFAVQLRANLNANRAQALAAWTMAAQAEKEALYRDPELSRLYREIVLEGKEPVGDEFVQFYALSTQFMNTWQLAFIQHRLGIMDSRLLDRVSSGYAIYLRSKHMLHWWREVGRGQYDLEFVDYVEKQLKGAD